MAKSRLPDDLLKIPEAAASPLDRMPPIPDEQMTPEQQAAAEEFAGKRGVKLGGPFIPLLRSPEVLKATTHLGAYLRFKCALPETKLSELAILITARRWTQNYEWHAHRKIALHAGLDPAIADAIAEGRRPTGMSEDEAIVYEFCTELHNNGGVCDPTYARASTRYGEQAIIDMAALCGYYSMLAMVMNVARTQLPAGVEPGLKPLLR